MALGLPAMSGPRFKSFGLHNLRNGQRDSWRREMNRLAFLSRPQVEVQPASRCNPFSSHWRANFSEETPLARLSASSFRLEARESLM